MILLQDVSFSYLPEQPPVFDGLSLSIPQGAWVTVSGPDGSGKTSLGKLIKGLLRPVSGSITFTGDGGEPPFVGYLGGDPYDALVGISVEEDIAFGLENMNLPSEEIGRRVAQAASWTGLSGLEQRLVHTLSGGEQQKLALAGILAMGGRILVMDEAMNMLDRRSRRAVRSLIRALQNNPGLTIVEITQSLPDLMTSDRVIFLSNGATAFDGLPKHFLATEDGKRWARIAGGVSGLHQALLERDIPRERAGDDNLWRILNNYLNE
jgi:energy-coupling factor transport system ATP-binding protein